MKPLYTSDRTNLTFACVLACLWGAAWAAYLQYTSLGRFLAIRRTWVTVVVGVGVDMLITLPVLPWRYWLRLVAVISFSSIPIITRSLFNELSENEEWHNAIRSGRRKD